MLLRDANMSKYMLLQVRIEPDGNAYTASCPALPGCVTWGKTYKEAYKNIKEAVECHIEALQKLRKSRYVFVPKNPYIKKLRHPSVVTLVQDAA